jgi:hypothetical protein
MESKYVRNVYAQEPWPRTPSGQLFGTSDRGMAVAGEQTDPVSSDDR